MDSIEELMTYETPRHPAMPWLAAAECVDAEDRLYARDWMAGSGGMESMADLPTAPAAPSTDETAP